jgi:hypothetical protein
VASNRDKVSNKDNSRDRGNNKAVDLVGRNRDRLDPVVQVESLEMIANSLRNCANDFAMQRN